MRVGPELLCLFRRERVEVPGLGLDRFLAEAAEHRVLPLVRQAAEEERLVTDDRTLLEASLVAHDLRAGSRAKGYGDLARDVVRKLAAVGCRPMVVKGWWSMHVLHGRASDRFTSDLDLVVPPEWADRREELTAVLGPSRADQRRVPSPGQHAAGWTFDLPGIAADLHLDPFLLEWPVAPRSPEIWADFTVVGGAHWAGARVPTLELGLVQLAANYFRDGYRWLFQMDDVRRLLVHEDLDWNTFWALADRAGMTSVMLSSLDLVVDSARISVPLVKGRRPWLLAPWTSQRAVLGGEAVPSTPLRVVAVGMLGASGPVAALGGLREWVWPGTERLASDLHLRGLPPARGHLRGLRALVAHRSRRMIQMIVNGGSTPGRYQRAVSAVSTIEEVHRPSLGQFAEALGWSLLTRLLLRTLSLRRTLALLDRLPRSRPRPLVQIPPESTFGRAGACLGRQVARSQYLRRRGASSCVVIGVQPPDADGLDAHAWLDRLDERPLHQVLHRIER